VQLGRFINRDPIGYDGGDANLYRYVGNRPTDLVDPMGLAHMWVGMPWPYRWEQFQAARTYYWKAQSDSDTAEMARAARYVSTMTQTVNPPAEGVKLEGTTTTTQNCLAAALGMHDWVMWKGLDHPRIQNVPLALSYVPQGCKEASCDGISIRNSPCCKGAYEGYGREVIVQFFILGNFGEMHAVGRDAPVSGAMPNYWSSTAPTNPGITRGSEGRWVFISDVDAHTKAAYPDYWEVAGRPGGRTVKRCFCCKTKKLVTKAETRTNAAGQTQVIKILQ